MNIVVCLKQVPDTGDVKIDPRTGTLIREGVKHIINPLDTYALEEAVRMRERYEGKVTVVSMGPPQVEAALREAISLGADEAMLLSDRAFAGADTWATALTLAAAVNKQAEYDLVICGQQTLDGDTGQVGPELAEMLETSFVAYVSQVEEVTGTHLRVRRLVEDGYEIIEAALPAVITVVKEINQPRLPSLRGITRSRSAAIPVLTASDLGLDESQVGLAGSFTRVVKLFSPEKTCSGEIFQGEAENQVDCLIGRLKDTGII